MTANSSSNSGEIVVHVFGKTDVGRTREHNEDAFVVADLNTMNATLQPEVRTHKPGQMGSLFMVADGMGGAAAGEVASAMATEVVLGELDTRWRHAQSHDAETFARAIKAATETANARIHRYATEHPENRGMGTTATIAGLLGDTLYLAQVGDSRAYLVRNGIAQQITKDQSLMQKLVEAGELTAEEAEVSERRNIILQALGPEPVVKVDLTSQQVRKDDVLVLCSDGLSGQIRTGDISDVVGENRDLVDVCKKLIDMANENGGPDNITVIAVRFDGSGLSAASSGEGVGHKVYTGQSEQRATMPVDLNAVRDMDPEAVTAESPARQRHYQSGPTAPMIPPVLPKPGVEGKVPTSVLRLIFGAIAGIIIVLLYFKFRGLMRIELRITSGSRAGQRESFDKSVISIGRHPLNDLRFDPERDPDASSKHAEIRVMGDKATIHDLDSTNGTFVNGQRIAGERALFDGDLLSFGREGPAVEFHALTAAPPPTQAAASNAPDPAPARPSVPRRDTTARIADAVQEQTGSLRKMVIGVGILAIVAAGGAYWFGHNDSAKAVDALMKRNDSLSAEFEKTVGSMRGKVAGLDSALAASKKETDQIRSRIKGEMQKGGDANVEELSARLDLAEKRQRALVSAGAINYESIAAKNGPAIVFIAVQEADESLMSGSGFNVMPSGLIVTNRHVVQDAQGRAAKRVKVIFDNTKGAWKTAHVVYVSKEDELALIKIDDAGTYPVVVGVAKQSGVRVGAAVALLGYPLGTSTAGMGGNINTLQPKATLALGTVSKVLADTLQFDAFAAPGSSGSAVFDSRGFVVGVLFGGQTESNGRIVYAVPSEKLVKQLPPEAAAIVR